MECELDWPFVNLFEVIFLPKKSCFIIWIIETKI